MISPAHLHGQYRPAQPVFRNGRLGSRPASSGKAGQMFEVPNRPSCKFRASVSKVHTPRYVVAGWSIDKTRRNLRFYALHSKIRLSPKLIELQGYRRASAYGLRRAAENCDFLPTRLNLGERSWLK